MKHISVLSALLILSTNAFALDYNYEKWQFKLDAEGMVGFLNPKTEQPLFINDWDIKGQVFYGLNRTQKLGAVYSIDAACVEDDEYILSFDSSFLKDSIVFVSFY